MKKVTINSTRTIMVTSGLQYQDLTPESDIPNRMKIAPAWKKQLVRQGIHNYPADVADWPTVKALEKQGILTINGFEDDEPEEEPEEVVEKPRRRRKTEVGSLADAAGE